MEGPRRAACRLPCLQALCWRPTVFASDGGGRLGDQAMVLGEPMKAFSAPLHYVVPVLVLVAAIGVRWVDPAPVQLLRLNVFDTYQQLEPRDYEPVPVRIVDIDDDSLERIGQWPWPRTVVADMVARLVNAGAASIAFDMVFAEPDRTSPSVILPQWAGIPELEDIRQKLASLPDNDAVLADIVGQAGNVATGFVMNYGAMPRRPEAKPGFAHGGLNPRYFAPTYTGAVATLDEIQQAAAGNGSFNMLPDSDGKVRRVPMLVALSDSVSDLESSTLLPSLSAEALRVAQGAGSIIVKSLGASGDALLTSANGIQEVKIGAVSAPTDPKGQVLVHFTRGVPERYVPAWQIFEGTFDPNAIAGNILFIGTSAAGLFDLRNTPLNPVLPGVEVHVQAVEQMLTQHFLYQPDWGVWAEILFMTVVGLLLIILIPRIGAAGAAALGGVLVGMAVFVAWYLFSLSGQRILIDPVFSAAATLFVYLTSSVIVFLKTDAERRNVRNAFGRYLSPALVEQLAANPQQLQLGGERRDMTLMFSDIRGFTTISEQFPDPQDLTRFINRFLTPMTDIILRERGTIDKYMGDCIMAFWNAPITDEDHAAQACISALKMCQERDSMNATLKQEAEAEQRKFIPINIGIGLNTGPCCVGNMGSEQRFDYSVLGDDVNLASRLEGQSKTYGVDIVIGPNTYVQAPGFAALEMDLIQVKGKTTAVRIYCLLGDREFGASPEFQAVKEKHDLMLAAYRRQQWNDVRGRITELREMANRTWPTQTARQLNGFYDLLMGRMEEYEANPLPADWDGVFVATSK